MKNSIYLKFLPIFTFVLLVFWGFELWNNIKAGRNDRMILDIVLCVVFGIAFIGSVFLQIKLKKL